MHTANSSLAADRATRTVFPILIAISFSHLLNDAMQSLIPAMYPVILYVFHVCSYLPLLGLLTGWLPKLDQHARG